MKRIECFLAAVVFVASIATASAMIPEQVRIESGLLAGTASTGQPARACLQGHSVRRAAAR